MLFQYPNVGDLLKTIGVKVEEVKSSPLKAAPNGYEPTSPEARAAIEALVKDSYAWFRGMVRDRRKMDDATLDTRRPTAACSPAGRRSTLKLIDQLGNEKTAVAWLDQGKGPQGRHAGARLAAQAALQRSLACCTSRPPSLLDAVGLRLARASASRVRLLGGRATQS